MAAVQQLLYAASPQHITAIMLDIEADWEDRYPQFVKYVCDLYNRREEWALCFRDTVPNRGQTPTTLWKQPEKLKLAVIMRAEPSAAAFNASCNLN